MLSKEEIEYIEDLEKAIEDNDSFYWQEDMYELIEIIRKQHGREQKLIEKLEEDIREETGYAKWTNSYTKEISPAVTRMISKSKYAQEILSILKGESQVTVK